MSKLHRGCVNFADLIQFTERYLLLITFGVISGECEGVDDN